MLVSLPLLILGFVEMSGAGNDQRYVPAFAWFCGAFTLFFLVYLVWTHRLFSRTAPDVAMRIAAAQHTGRASHLSRLLGLKSAEDWGMHVAGETITFDIDEDPTFVDFLSMAVMVSSVGAMSAGTPRTRLGLSAVRTHTFISFAFNAIVVAMAVSLITGFIASGT